MAVHPKSDPNAERNPLQSDKDVSVINSNIAASTAAYNLDRTSLNLQRSLQRLASGSRIHSAADDAGGLAVSMKLSAAIRRNQATTANVGNALAFLETQDGVMKVADRVITRMSELASLATDVTKNSTDLANYSAEFQNLQRQLAHLGGERFNGISLFVAPSTGAVAVSTTAGSMSVVTSEEGTQAVGISIHAINTDPWMDMLINGFVSFTDPANSANRIYVPDAPQNINGYLESGQTFDLDQVTTVTQNWTETFSLPAGHLNRSATIPAHNYTNGSGITMAAATAVTVPVSIVSPPLVSLGGNSYGLNPTLNPAYVTTPTYRQLAENIGTGTFIDPMHAGTTTLSSITVQYSPSPSVYTRPEDGSTTSAISLNSPTDVATVTNTLEPWSGNGIASSAVNASGTPLGANTAGEFGLVARKALESLAKMRAQNGAEQSRLHFAGDMLAINQINLQQANSRIQDVDVAAESSQLARWNILQQAGTAMLAQANSSAQSILRLIE